MHLSSGYTVDKETGFRFVFNWNRERYPDFEALMRTYHESGIRVCANIKVRAPGPLDPDPSKPGTDSCLLTVLQPYVSSKHPSYERLRAAGALFRDPATGEHSTTVSQPAWLQTSAGSLTGFLTLPLAMQLVWSGLFEENFAGSWVVRIHPAR
jgi:hypothetical protein